MTKEVVIGRFGERTCETRQNVDRVLTSADDEDEGKGWSVERRERKLIPDRVFQAYAVFL